MMNQTDDSMKLTTILRVMNDKTFGLRARLFRLIASGMIRAEKGNREAQNGKWLVNASDCLRFAKV